jgi:3-hydroxyacyl-[acyl-carrier-protein] dehydratase
MITDTVTIDQYQWMETVRGVSAKGRVPNDGEFFQDHFPAFPILPGVLALEILKRTAERYLTDRLSQEGRPGRFLLKQVRSVKFTHYLKPGDEWESRLELVNENGSRSEWKGQLLHGDETAVSARLVFENVKSC